MFAASSPSESTVGGNLQPRVRGGLRLCFRDRNRQTHAASYEERDGYKIRFPRGGHGCEGVIINTGGGVAGGDLIAHAVTLEAGASATLTTPAAERIYRSNGDVSRIDISMGLQDGASLAWLPQETILFAEARLQRRFEIDMAPSASLLMAEITVFGRKEMGEAINQGSYIDRWHVRRDGCLVFAENVRFGGDLAAALKKPAIGNGARVMGTVLYVAASAESKLEPVRAVLTGAASRLAASAWNGLLCIRCLGDDLEAVRRDLSRALILLRQQPMPRVWHI
ncbi:MAG: urease accessory protein UreD [Rhodomicrobium sp.]